jgi:hypothetical protein
LPFHDAPNAALRCRGGPPAAGRLYAAFLRFTVFRVSKFRLFLHLGFSGLSLCSCGGRLLRRTVCVPLSLRGERLGMRQPCCRFYARLSMLPSAVEPALSFERCGTSTSSLLVAVQHCWTPCPHNRHIFLACSSLPPLSRSLLHHPAYIRNGKRACHPAYRIGDGSLGVLMFARRALHVRRFHRPRSTAHTSTHRYAKRIAAKSIRLS